MKSSPALGLAAATLLVALSTICCGDGGIAGEGATPASSPAAASSEVAPDEGGLEASLTALPQPTAPTGEAELDEAASGDEAVVAPPPTAASGEGALDEQEGGQGSDERILLVTPFVNELDLASINEAFSASEDAPWGFEHRGIDLFPSGDLRPFQAVCSGVVDAVDVMQLEATSNWQVRVRLVCNSTYSANYAFEPMTDAPSDGETQLANILVSEGQRVAQGELIGHLLARNEGSHVDFGFNAHGEPVCPEPYLTEADRAAILRLVRVVWPDAEMCYE